MPYTDNGAEWQMITELASCWLGYRSEVADMLFHRAIRLAPPRRQADVSKVTRRRFARPLRSFLPTPVRRARHHKLIIAKIWHKPSPSSSSKVSALSVCILLGVSSGPPSGSRPLQFSALSTDAEGWSAEATLSVASMPILRDAILLRLDPKHCLRTRPAASSISGRWLLLTRPQRRR